MTYKEIVRYASTITKNDDVARDIVHDFYLRLHKQGVDLLNGKLPKNFIYKGLQRTNIDFLRKYYIGHEYRNRGDSIRVFVDVCELKLSVDALSPVDLAISRDILMLCKQCISQGYLSLNFRGNNKPESFYQQIFDYYALGYVTKDIAKVLEISEQQVDYYRYKIQSWIKPILKE